MNLTKQQTISLHLAKWLGRTVIAVNLPQYQNTEFQIVVQGGGTRTEVFNPFASTIEGRAQFAECVIKAIVYDIADSMDKATRDHDLQFDGAADGAVSSTLEAIYYAIGGMREWAE